MNITDDKGNSLPFDDGCNIMYINGDYRGSDALGKLMHDFSTPNADEMYYDALAQKVKYHKQDSKGVQQMCKVVEEYGDLRAAKAAQQNTIENARKLLADGKYTAEEISELFNIPVETFTVNAED